MNNFLFKRFILLAFGLFIVLLPDISKLNSTLTYDAKIVLRMLLLMIFLWFTEIIPISITAMMPILFSPFFLKIELDEIVRNYGSPVVFLLLGGFIIAQGFESSKLHKRIALKTILFFGNTRDKIIMSIIASTAFFSMWISNTATCLLMLPIVKNIIENNFKSQEDNNFSKILLLSIAYSASIGGMATPIGTIPNAVMIGYLQDNHNLEIDFLKWFIFVSPLVLVLLLLLFFYLRSRFQNNKKKIKIDYILDKYNDLGKISSVEKTTILILVLTISLWIFKKPINDLFGLKLTDSIIAIFGSVLFFIIPVKRQSFILDFDWYKNIPWNVLILFGGGLSMASLIITTGLADEFSKSLDHILIYNIFLIIFFIALLTSLMTEFTSNTATTFLFLPILSLFALNNGIDILLITLPFVLAASCAFMMPIATPPNAIVYSSNKFNISFMVSNGFFINVISISMITLYVFLFRSF